ncbi:DUF1275 family protein, partial [Streptomyces diastatochromogenes]|uniref:DUF1275 family protein n=1 Tax=Streptomyces diastatochromogenes TaxID=42236 RepID=UPI00368DE2FB
MPGDQPRREVRIVVVLFTLTVTAAAVDAVTFLGLGHAFAALATGNVLLLGFGVANAGTPVARPAEALAAFAVGVAAAHTLVVRLHRRGRRWFTRALAVAPGAPPGPPRGAPPPPPRASPPPPPPSPPGRE